MPGGPGPATISLRARAARLIAVWRRPTHVRLTELRSPHASGRCLLDPIGIGETCFRCATRLPDVRRPHLRSAASGALAASARAGAGAADGRGMEPALGRARSRGGDARRRTRQVCVGPRVPDRAWLLDASGGSPGVDTPGTALCLRLSGHPASSLGFARTGRRLSAGRVGARGKKLVRR
jgi:hypothetical protein